MKTVTIKFDRKKSQYYFSDFDGENQTDHFPPAYGKLFVLRQAIFFALEHKCDRIVDSTCSPPKTVMVKEGTQEWVE